jgi:hypothetical protein
MYQPLRYTSKLHVWIEFFPEKLSVVSVKLVKPYDFTIESANDMPACVSVNVRNHLEKHALLRIALLGLVKEDPPDFPTFDHISK